MIRGPRPLAALDPVEDGGRFPGGVVMQAQDHQVHAGHQFALGRGVLAQFRRDAHQLDAGHLPGAAREFRRPVVPASPSMKTLGILFPINLVLNCKPDPAILVRCTMLQCSELPFYGPARFPFSRLACRHNPRSSREPSMKIHEYQGKEILRNFGVPVPRGIPAFTVQEAVEAAQKLGGPVWVVKAQIHAGGRGKGGGVKLARSVDEVKRLAGQILGMQLVTHQTGPEGQKVRRLLIEDGADIKKEYYVSVVTDRGFAEGRLMASSEGRHGHRGSGARHAGEDHQGLRRPAGRPDRRAGQGTGQRHRRARRLHGPGRGRVQEALQVLHGHRRLAWSKSTR